MKWFWFVLGIYYLTVRITFISEFYLYLTGLSDAQVAGTTLFLGVSVKVSLAEISIWTGSLTR